MIKKKTGVNKHKNNFFPLKPHTCILLVLKIYSDSHILMLQDVINILWHFCVIRACERKVIEESVKPPWSRKIGIVMQKSTSQNNSSSHSNRRVGLYLICLLWTCQTLIDHNQPKAMFILDLVSTQEQNDTSIWQNFRLWYDKFGQSIRVGKKTCTHWPFTVKAY